MLLRDFIGKRLNAYFAQRSELVVGSIAEPVHFRRILGEWHWKRIYAKLYKEQQGQWLTPVELFRPHYSNVLADYIAKEYQQAQKLFGVQNLEIIELGGGRGTNARIILDRLHANHYEVYTKISTYTVVDASPTLHELQQQQLLSSNNTNKVHLLQSDLSSEDFIENHIPSLGSDTLVFTLALECLDNLPHDKVMRCVHGGGMKQAEVHMSQKTKDITKYEEVFVPLNDRLLNNVVSEISRYRDGKAYYVPTAALNIISKTIERQIHPRLFIADFSWLPPPHLVDGSQNKVITAWGEPLVTDMNGNDHDNYLDAAEKYCDILFPTDFNTLSSFISHHRRKEKRNTGKLKAIVMKQGEFFEKHMKDGMQETRTITGYNPLRDDFGNCSVLTTTAAKNDED